MNIASFTKQQNFKPTKIVTQVILETFFSKEIRMLLDSEQIMKE